MRITSSSSGSKKSKGGGFIAAIVFIAFAIGLNYFTSDMIDEAKESENWPSVPGVVTSSEISSYVSRSDGKDQTMYSAEVGTSYEVEGKSYSTSMINLAGSSSTSVRSSVKKKIDKYPKGSSVTVYFDPDDPGHAVLEPGMPLLFWILRIAPLVLFVFAALIIIRTILKLAGLITALGFLAAKREKKPAAAPSPPPRPAAAPKPKQVPDSSAKPETRPVSPSLDDSGGSDDGFSI